MEYKNSQQNNISNNFSSNINNSKNNSNGNNKSKGFTVKLYIQSLGESIKNICSKYNIQTYFKGNKTLKSILVSPKDKDIMEQNSRITYWYRCQELECDDAYIEGSARTFGERFKKHLTAPSSTYSHQATIGHPTTLDNFSIVGREGQGFARTIKESIFIRVTNSIPYKT